MKVTNGKLTKKLTNPNNRSPLTSWPVVAGLQPQEVALNHVLLLPWGHLLLLGHHFSQNLLLAG
jgi:hypothetical protein